MTQYFVAIPLRSNRYAIALIAAHASGLICLHVFDTQDPSPTSAQLAALTPCDVICTVLTLDIPLIGGVWDVIDHASLDPISFRTMWGVPCFGSVNLEDFQHCVRVELSDDLITRIETPCSIREGLRLDRDCTFGTEGLLAFLEDLLLNEKLKDPFWWHRRGRESRLEQMQRAKQMNR